MAFHRSRESSKFFGSIIDPKNAEDLQRTKIGIENNISKILKLIKNKNYGSKDGNPKQSGTELVRLMEDLYKQHQSLYAQYDRVTEEFERAISRKRMRKTPMSSSDSDSEYFSSEEVDGNKRRLEKEYYTVSIYGTPRKEPDRGDGANDVPMIDTAEFEEQLTSLMKEVESLSQQKKDLELQVESQTHEGKHESSKDIELHDQVLDLELLLKEEKRVVSDLQEKLKQNENQAKSNIAKLMAKINELELETKTLQTQKNEMDEKIKLEKDEASIQREDLMEHLNAMQQKLDSMENHNKELESDMENQREQISQDLIQIENLKDDLAEMRLIEHDMMEEKEGFLERIRDIELNLDTLYSQKNELEEQVRDINYEIKQMMDENKALQERNRELRTSMTQRGEEISNFLREHENHKNGAAMEVMELKAKVNTMRLELDTMHEQKNKLEMQNERSQKEYSESMTKLETLNAKLTTQISDQEKTIERLSEENKHAKIVFGKLKAIQGTADRKMNELAEVFRRKMEDNIRLLHQRLHVAEQLNNENKTSCKITKKRYEEENRIMRLKIASYEGERTAYVPDGFDLTVLNRLGLAVGKVEEQAQRVSGIKCEVDFVKDWVTKRNLEVKELRENVVSLRENVWKLEANVSKEGGEKLNLRNEVTQLEKKVAKLEKIVKEKDDELVTLGEKKREAIRQLCFLVDFHRDRCNYLKDILKKKRIKKMVKHRFRESIKSLFDPNKEDQLQEAKAEIEDKVKRILKLIKDDNLEEDSIQVELSKKEPLVELIEDFHNHYQSLYAQYDNLTGELRKRIKGKREKGSSSSSSDSDSDYSSKDKDNNKNGQLENEFQKTIDGLKQELEVAHIEVAELNRNLTITHEGKEDLNSKYLAALSKIQEADKINMDLKTDAEALGTQRSKLLVENVELNKQLDIAAKREAELSQRLEDLMTEKESLTTEKETGLQLIEEEKKITDGLRILVDQLKDEKLALGKELEAVTGELSTLKQQLEHAEQQMTNISHNLKVAEEENESLKVKLSQASNEVQLAHNRIQEFVAESSQLKEKHDERGREISVLNQMHEGYQKESSNQIRELEAQVTNLELELESLQNQKRDMEEKIKSSTTEARELGEHNSGLQNQISELELKSREREEELSAMMKKLEDNENESSSKLSDLTSQINKLLADIGTLHAQKNELEEQIIFKSNEASSQVQSITNEVNALQQEVESLQHQKSDFEVQLVEKVQENSEYAIQMQTLKEEIDRKILEQERLLEDRESLAMQMRTLELEMDTLKNKNSEAEEQLSAKSHEIGHMRQEMLELHEKIAEIEKISTDRESDFFALQDKFINAEKVGSAQIMASSEQIKNLEHDLASLQTEKQELEQQCEKLKMEVDSIQNQKSEIEEQIRAKDHENTGLREGHSGLQGTITVLEKTLVEKEAELSTLQEKLHEKESEASSQMAAFTVQIDNLQHDLASFQNDKQELEQQCENLKMEVDSIQNQKSEVEEQIRAKDRENTGLREGHFGLQGTITVLEKTLVEKETELSTLQEKLHEKESEASGQITAFTVQIDNLKHDLASLQNEKEELEQQCEKLKMELDSTHNQKGEIEEQMRAKDLENTGLREGHFGLQGTINVLEKTLAEKEAELSTLQEKLHEKESKAYNLKHDLASLQNEKQELEQHCEKLKMEVDSTHNQKGEVEEQMRAKNHENTVLREEVLGLQETITALEKTLAEKESELSTLEEKLHEKEKEASGHITAFTIQLDNQKHDLASLQNEKQELEQQCEKLKMELDSTHNQKGEIEEQMRAKDLENTGLREGHFGLQGTINVLEKTLAEKASELSALQEKHHEKESEASQQIIAFTAQIDNLKHDLASLQNEKQELEQHCEKLKMEVDSTHNQKGEVEEQMRAKNHENTGLREEALGLQETITALQKTLVEKETELSTLQEKLHEKESEASGQITAFAVQIDNLKHDLTSLQNEKEELEQQCEKLKMELDSTHNQKGEIEEQMRAKDLENTGLREGHFGLQGTINVLEKSLAEKESELSTLQEKHHEKESEASQQIIAFTAQIDNLKHDLASLQNEKQELEQHCEKLKMEVDSTHNQKGEVEEQLRAKDNENTGLREEVLGLLETITALEKTLAEKESELSTLQEKLREKENEASDQITAFTVQLDNQKHDLASLQNEKQELEQQCEKLKMELDSTHNQKGEVEEQMRAKDRENTGLREEILGLQGTITALEKTLAEKESELSTLQEKHHEKVSEASGQIIAFTAQIDNLQKELLSLRNTKEELELHCERISEQHVERLTVVENEKNDISSKTLDLKRTLEEREDSYHRLNEEYKQIESLFKECMVKLEVAEKKIEEMAGEFHEGVELKDQMVANLEHTVEDLKRDLEEKGDEIGTLFENVRMLEVKLRLSNQKLRVTEQLLSEKEESFRKTEEKFQQDQRELEDRIATLSAIISANHEAFDEIVSNIRECVNSVMTGIETVSWKVSDDCKNYEDCISNVSRELEVAKDHVREMNKEKEQLRREKNHLLEQLQVKTEHELALRKSVEKLEAKASKEESEKMNLTTTVVQLKKTVGELEKRMKEKEDGMLDLGEEKREVIRQLCLWIDYHRTRYDYLKDILSKTRRGQRAA
ncbi:hypothetical protein CR513_22152, partial [Mucuna pruriens]